MSLILLYCFLESIFVDYKSDCVHTVNEKEKERPLDFSEFVIQSPFSGMSQGLRSPIREL